MKLIFVRHTSVDVPKGVCYGQTDVPLAASFLQEAGAVREKLKSHKIDKAYTSPLSRCRKLAAYCGWGSAVADSRLMEMDFGEWEMKRYDDIKDSRLKLWYDDWLNVAATGGESSSMQRARFEDFLGSLRRLHGSDETIAVFTHGGIMIHSLVLLGGLSYQQAFAKNPPYGSILEFTQG